MSTKAIWNLNANRHELGNARKWQIYLSKITIGVLVAAALWLVSLASMQVMFIGSLAVFVTSKVAYYVDTGDWPDGWDAVADWICDGVLHMTWYGLWLGYLGDWKIPGVMFAAWICTYPWSCE